ncbi:MAG: regulatory protein RecX [Candidatus Neomarinimicrobiota bacterium]|jgi:regulatory protein|nr:regulatory protein RecX [Candidatus Neomarinimicrobiota bacterium]
MGKRKIIDIQIQKRRKNRRSIFLDDGSVFGVSEDVFFSIPVQIGDTITDRELDNILVADNQQKILDFALNLLSYRMRSKVELMHRLKRKKFNEDGIYFVMEKLETKGYLDDQKFAQAFAREKVRRKLIGPMALRSEFSVHMLDPDILEYTLKKTYDEFPEHNLMDQLLKKRKVPMNKPLDIKEKKNAVNTLRNKGFSWDRIQEILVKRGNI